ncbi:MAG: hypothetical protein PQJ59_12340 [Spirochaetales bacterium]|nr:hypothetical protein [Spirochaetales bacterium]
MKKTIFTAMMITAAAGAALFANGADEAARGRGGEARGFAGPEGVEIVSIEGTVEKDSYGNMMIDDGKTNYLIAPVRSMDLVLEEGDVVDGEGVEGNLIYTKDGEDYVNFHLTMATVDGEEYVLDMKKMAGAKGAQGGRDMGRDNGRGADRGNMHDDQKGGDRPDHDGERGGYAIAEDAEEITLSGAITFVDEFHPVIEADGVSYLFRMGRDNNEAIEDGAAVEVTGYVGPAIPGKDGKEYYGLKITTLTVNGEVIEVEAGPMNKGDRSMGRRG